MGTEGVNFVLALSTFVNKLGIIRGDDFCPGMQPDALQKLRAMRKQPMNAWDVDVFISHKQPTRFPNFPYNGIVKVGKRPKYVVGRSMTGEP